MLGEDVKLFPIFNLDLKRKAEKIVLILEESRVIFSCERGDNLQENG